MVAQLDFLTFFPQLIWLYFFFLIFYFCLVSYFLPKLYSMLKVRYFFFNLSVRFFFIKDLFYMYLMSFFSLNYNPSINFFFTKFSVFIFEVLYRLFNVFLINLISWFILIKPNRSLNT